MLKFYSAVFLLSVLFLLVGVGLPANSELLLTDKLALYPESWSVSLSSDQKLFRNVTDGQAKARILRTLQAHRPSHIDWSFMSVFIGSALFSFIGYRREIWFARALHPTAERPK